MSFANVSFKIIYNGEIRRFTKPKPTFEQFNSIIRSLLGTSYPALRVCYRDEEGDVISVSSELEWDSALEYLSKDRLVRFVLYDRSVNPTVSFFQKAEMGAASVFGSQIDSKKDVNLTKEEAEERKNKFLKSLEECRPKSNLSDPNRKQSKEEEEKKKAAEEIQKLLAEELKEEKEKKEAEERTRKEAEERAKKEAEEERARRELEERTKRETEERTRKEAEEGARKEAELQLENERLLRLREQEEEQRRILEEKRKHEEAEQDAIKKALEEAEEKMRQQIAEEEKKKDSLLSALTEEWETLGQHFERGDEVDKKKREEEEALQKKKEAEDGEKAALLKLYQKELGTLREMGFTEQEKNLALLKKHAGSVALALDELVSVP